MTINFKIIEICIKGKDFRGKLRKTKWFPYWQSVTPSSIAIKKKNIYI